MIKGSKCKPFTEEHKRKISESKMGQKYPTRTIEHRIKISEYRTGKLHTEETKMKISKIHKGKHISEEQKKKLSHAVSGNKNPFYGRHHTEESKQKISESNMGNFVGEKNPSWLGGKSFELYTINWTQELKRLIIDRDEHICQLCGVFKVDFSFDVHHINYDKKNCNPDNLITLCKKCHMKTNFNREHWKYFFERSVKYRCLLT